MKKKAVKRKRADVVVPPITVDFEEAVSRLLKVQPPKKSTPKKLER